MTDTKRSYNEELLISTAADNGISKLKLKELSGKKVKVDFSNLKSTDQDYVKAAVLRRIGASGAYIITDKVKSADQDVQKGGADFIIEVFCGGLATNSSSWLLGFPPITIPIPLSGPAQIPEIAFLKVISQDAVGKFGFRVYDVQSGKQIDSRNGILGKARYHHYVILGVPWSTSTVPGL